MASTSENSKLNSFFCTFACILKNETKMNCLKISSIQKLLLKKKKNRP